MVGVDQIFDGRLELGDADVAAVGERQLVRTGQTLHVAGSFRWSEIAAVGKHGQDVALHRIGELRLRAGEWPQVTKKHCVQELTLASMSRMLRSGMRSSSAASRAWADADG